MSQRNQLGEQPFVVTTHAVAVITDLVYARSEGDAIKRVERGRGYRLGARIDEDQPPIHLSAIAEGSVL